MVFCIVGFVVFGVLAVFSAKYRTYFRETVHCIKRQVTLRPCDTQFDEKMKSKISAKLIRISPGMAGFVYRKFWLVSWMFLILTIISIALIAQTSYNLAVYGTCDPQTGNCVFRPGYTINESCANSTYDCVAIGCTTSNATICDLSANCRRP